MVERQESPDYTPPSVRPQPDAEFWSMIGSISPGCITDATSWVRNISPDTWFEIARLVATITSIAIPALVAIRSIRGVAEESRLSSVHSEMRSCLIKAVDILGRALDLLDAVSRNVTYRNILTQEPIETAHQRFWREIDPLVTKYKKLTSSLRLLLPKDLTEKLRVLVGKINTAKNFAVDSTPSPELRNAVEDAGRHYRDFINACRAYIKADELKPLDSLTRHALESLEQSA